MRDKIAEMVRNCLNGETDWDEMLDQLCDLHDVSNNDSLKNEQRRIWYLLVPTIEQYYSSEADEIYNIIHKTNR